MESKNIQALVRVLVVCLIGAALAWAGSWGGASIGAMPIFALCVLVAFGVQWIAFIPAYKMQTEHFLRFGRQLDLLNGHQLCFVVTGGTEPALLHPGCLGGHLGGAPGQLFVYSGAQRRLG